jgi:hypothetical protein
MLVSGDAWLAPDTCGVKLAEFERLTQLVTRAGPKLEELSHALWQALSRAGVSTAPAMDIARSASWAKQAGPELQRRNQLAHDMDREKLSFGVCRADGTFLLLPDRYNDQLAQFHGREAARLLGKGAVGDSKALAALRTYGMEASNSYFATAMMEELGAKGLIELPVKMAVRLYDLQHSGDDSHRLEAATKENQALLELLSRSLGTATDPTRPVHLTQAFTEALKDEGRALHKVSGVTSGYGYWGLGQIMLAIDPNRPYSIAFIRDLGRDMIAWDRALAKSNGRQSAPGDYAPFSDGVGNQPGTPQGKYFAGVDPFTGLMHALGTNKDAAQQVLDFPPDPEGADAISNLRYLLHDRRPIWGLGDRGAALGEAMRAAMSGQDSESERLAFEAGDIIAGDARKLFTVNSDGKMLISDPAHIDDLSALRPLAGEIFASHMEKINRIFSAGAAGAQRFSTPMDTADLDYLLLDLTRDGSAFTALLKAQVGHAKGAIDNAVARNPSHLNDVLVGEIEVFGHLLEARGQTVIAETGRIEGINAEFRNMVAEGIGYIPIPYSGKIGNLAKGALGDLIGSNASGAYDQFAKGQYDKFGNWLAKSAEAKPVSGIAVPATDLESVQRLINQMIISSTLTHHNYEPVGLAGQSFATNGHPPQLRSLDSLTGLQYEDFVAWTGDHSRVRFEQNWSNVTLLNSTLLTAMHYTSSDGQHHATPTIYQ